MIDPARLDALDRQVLDHIEGHGWHLTGVAPRVGDTGAVFTYTAGLTLLHHPELIIFGLPVTTAAGILNGLGERIRAGARLTPHEQLNDVLDEGFPLALVEVLDSTEHLTIANRFFGENGQVPAIQIVWPDSSRRFPWDDGYDVSPDRQPVIGPW